MVYIVVYCQYDMTEVIIWCVFYNEMKAKKYVDLWNKDITKDGAHLEIREWEIIQ